MPPVVLADFVNRADVRMVQRGRGARFAQESFQRRLSRRNLAEETSAPPAAPARVLGAIDHAHPAAAQPLHHAIMPTVWPISDAGSGMAAHHAGRPLPQVNFKRIRSFGDRWPRDGKYGLVRIRSRRDTRFQYRFEIMDGASDSLFPHSCCLRASTAVKLRVIC